MTFEKESAAPRRTDRARQPTHHHARLRWTAVARRLRTASSPRRRLIRAAAISGCSSDYYDQPALVREAFRKAADPTTHAWLGRMAVHGQWRGPALRGQGARRPQHLDDWRAADGARTAAPGRGRSTPVTLKKPTTSSSCNCAARTRSCSRVLRGSGPNRSGTGHRVRLRGDARNKDAPCHPGSRTARPGAISGNARI